MGREWASEWMKGIWKTRNQLLISGLMLFLAFLANYYSGRYVDSAATVAVNDLILDAIPPIDVSFIFIYFFLFTIYSYYIYGLFSNSGKFHYYVSMFALLAIVRSGFIVLTHLQGIPDFVGADFPSGLGFFVYTNDLFFSGHTAFPFMGFLVFRKRWIKGFFLAASIILGASTLLMHAHYSIDVFAAFFIAYGVYKIGNKIFEGRFYRSLERR